MVFGHTPLNTSELNKAYLYRGYYKVGYWFKRDSFAQKLLPTQEL